MKRLLFIIAFMPSVLFAQIGEIKTHEKPGEFIYHCVYHDKPSDKYWLHAQSDNRYETKVMRVFLGNNSTEAVKSLANFLDAFNNLGTQFELGDCTFIVATSGSFIRVLNRGQLEYTAGNYYIQRANVDEAIVYLINSRGAAVGQAAVYVENITKGKLRVFLTDYNTSAYISFNTNLKPYLARKYNQNDRLDDADVCALADAIESNQIPRSRFITEICLQIQK